MTTLEWCTANQSTNTTFWIIFGVGIVVTLCLAFLIDKIVYLARKKLIKNNYLKNNPILDTDPFSSQALFEVAMHKYNQLLNNEKASEMEKFAALKDLEQAETARNQEIKNNLDKADIYAENCCKGDVVPACFAIITAAVLAVLTAIACAFVIHKRLNLINTNTDEQFIENIYGLSTDNEIYGGMWHVGTDNYYYYLTDTSTGYIKKKIASDKVILKETDGQPNLSYRHLAGDSVVSYVIYLPTGMISNSSYVPLN